MKLSKKLAGAFGLGLLLAAARPAFPKASEGGEANVDELVREFRGEAEPRTRTPGELEAAYSNVLDALAPKMGGDDWGKGGGERRTFQRICWRAGRPGAGRERAALCRATAKKVLSTAPHVARVWMIRQLERIGRDEVVVPLTRLFEDRNAEIRECARRALENNPSPRATRALSGHLYRADTPEWRVALTTALGFRKDRAATGVLLEQAKSGNDEVRAAAVQALASIGDASAAEAIARAMAMGSERARRIARDSYLVLADGLSGKDAGAALEMYRKFLGEKGHLRCAAVVGLGRAGGTDELTVIIEALADEDPEVRGAGVIALEMMPIANLRKAVEEKLKTAAAKQKVGLLRVLAQHGDESTRPTFVAEARDPDEAVRIEALAALEKVGDASVVALLARAVGAGSKKERETARRSLDRIGDPEANRAILRHMKGCDAKLRAELIRSLAARGALEAVPELLGTAKEPDDTVRRESYRALGKLAGADALAGLVELLVKAKDTRDLQEAEKALTSTCRRVARAALNETGDVEPATRPVLAGQEHARDAAKQSLLRVLGKIGGRGALTAVRDALDDRNPETREAALRALADWPDAASSEDLLRLARSAAVGPDGEKQRILALRGYVRVVGLPSERPAEETLKMYGLGMRAARRLEEKRLVLAGIGDVKHLAALGALRSYMKDTDLADEAAVAMAKVARGISRDHREEAKTALREVAEVCGVETIRSDARKALSEIEMYEDYIPTWTLAGPYSKKGKNNTELFDIVFPPERPDPRPDEPRPLGAEETKWRVVFTSDTGAGGNGREPWLVEIDKIMRGSDRVCYLRAQVYSPAAQAARLDIGTDDGVKAWLNGQVVHESNVNRAPAPAQDKVKVSLKKGWNRLMLKVTQGGGGWAACARFRAPDGSRLTGPMGLMGLKVRVDPEIFLGHIMEWQLAGPYLKEGRKGADLFDVAFPPERPGAERVDWKPAKAGSNAGKPYIVEMDKILKGNERACYLRVQVFSPRDRAARLDIGSDDGVKAWLNGKLVRANNALRGVGVAQEKVKVTLKKGWNRLMLKVTQGGGEWSACARFRQPDGSAIEDLETKAEGW